MISISMSSKKDMPPNFQAPMRTIILIFLFTSLSIPNLKAQIEGDDLFGVDQIISVDLSFYEADYWTTLVDNYNATENIYLWADLTLTDITGTYTFDSVGVRLKGNSSYGHPGNKKAFKIDFNEFVAGQNYDGLKKLNFSNMFKDPSCMREKVFFDVCHSADITAPRSSFANVTFNGVPWGFYTVVEQIDDQFLDWSILDDNGNLFKAGDNFGGGPSGGGNAADLVYYGAEQSSYEARYELNTNEDINDWSDLISLIDFINNSSAAEFQDNVDNRIEFTEYLRSAALDNLFSNLDSYTGSARNYYVYHNMTTDKWHWIKWDANEAFGSYANGQNNITSLALNYRNADRPLLDKVFNDPVLYALYKEQACFLQENFFNSTDMNARINEIRDLIQSSVYADANKMYTNAQFETNIESNITSGGGPGGGTIYGLKSFVTARNNYLNGALDCSVFTGIEKPSFSDIHMYPNPANETLRIDWSEAQLQNINVLDLLGRTVATYPVMINGTILLDVSGLNRGIYIIQFQTKNAHLSEYKLTLE